MRISSLLYHDVVPAGRLDDSGFPGADSEVYKLTAEQFGEHLAAMHSRTGAAAITIHDALRTPQSGSDFLLTFDDGGASAATHIEPMLRRYGWRGHFFIPTNWIDQPGFLTRAGIRDLAARGHVVGTHSCSHPPMISRCSPQQLRREWGDSVAVLSDILGEPVTTGSVPAGFFSRRVADSAAEAGVKILFTSEPSSSVTRQDGCLLVGRYSIQAHTSARMAAALAAADPSATLRQWLIWNAKKPLKTLGGPYWLWFRKFVFASRTSARRTGSG